MSNVTFIDFLKLRSYSDFRKIKIRKQKFSLEKMTAQLFREIGPTQAKRMNKLITLVVCMMIACVKGQTCTTIPMDNKSACTVCTKNESFVNCTKSHSSGTLLLNETDCISQCCNTSSTDNSTQHSVCKTSKAIESKSHADTNVTIFILIIVFTIAGVVCCYCTCSYCLKKRRQRQTNEEDPDRKINLQTLNIHDLGPYYIQKEHNCSICLQDQCDVLTICKHYYHIQCLSAWVKKMRKCPMCNSTQINPIIYYCTKCSISVKLGIIVLNLGDGQVNDEKVVCKECKRKKQTQNCQSSVSLKEINQIERVQSSKGLVLP